MISIPRVSFVICTTAVNRDDDHVAKGYRLGAVDYLFKPVDPALLRAKVGAFVDLYARLDLAGQSFASVDLTAAAREALADLTPLLERTGGRVEIGELPTIDADPEQMRLLLRHLIANGLTYHRPGLAPVVEVGAEPLTDRRGTGGLLGTPLYQLVVSDNGAGFDPRHVDRVFGLFQHLNGYSRYEGLGIGLAICRKIAERHGGAISARSAPDAGARFIVTLPARHAHRVA